MNTVRAGAGCGECPSHPAGSPWRCDKPAMANRCPETSNRSHRPLHLRPFSYRQQRTADADRNFERGHCTHQCMHLLIVRKLTAVNLWKHRCTTQHMRHRSAQPTALPAIEPRIGFPRIGFQLVLSHQVRSRRHSACRHSGRNQPRRPASKPWPTTRSSTNPLQRLSEFRPRCVSNVQVTRMPPPTGSGSPICGQSADDSGTKDRLKLKLPLFPAACPHQAAVQFNTLGSMNRSPADRENEWRYPWVVAAQITLTFGFIALLPALWSFVSAIWSATTTGQVLVISVGRTGTSRSLVAWSLGWARFAAPPLLLAGLLMRVLTGSVRTHWWWSSVLLTTTALVLLFFSQWFTTLGGTVFFLCLLGYVGLAYVIDLKIGRKSVVVFLFATVALLLNVYLRRGN